jgi:hypothetical protein
MNKPTRDEFSAGTKDILAKRAGYICAYPDCKRMTIAGSNDRKSALTATGIAAHITAASEFGPRFDPKMSRAERASERNGIWMCQIHGKLIDDNPSECTIEELLRWKYQHEKWVFDRVESGVHLFNHGVCRVSFSNVGPFINEHVVPIGRHNVLVGPNAAGKTSFCQLVSAFTGGLQWSEFNQRFGFSRGASAQSFIELVHQNELARTYVKISPQFISSKQRSKTPQRIHIELNGSPSVDWPRYCFRVLHFDSQLSRLGPREPKDVLVKAIRYLANAFRTVDNMIWDALREEFFATSIFGYKLRRAGHRKIEILVPDGRSFYLPHTNLGHTELKMVVLEIAIKLARCSARAEHWFFMIDGGFFVGMDDKRKTLVFKKLLELEEISVQTIFCLHAEDDAEILKEIKSDKWVNATKFGQLTLHSFL